MPLPEGTEVDILILETKSPEDIDAFTQTFGAWKGALDVDAFLAGLRQPLTRPEPK
ncbi:MAG: hypothetical protein HYU51_06625 [Candidatus Rokubacteria bacterium]|nr:hypothetical protein [Candidatus Rokubacteria bacterium]